MKQETGIEQSMQHPRVEDFRSKERERERSRKKSDSNINTRRCNKTIQTSLALYINIGLHNSITDNDI